VEARGMVKKIRMLMAKAGLDGHQRGIRVVTKALRDAGIEVVYLGAYNTVEQIVGAAVQEDVDVIGLSSLCGAHRTVIPRIAALMKEKGLEDVLLTVGGIIPDKDIPALLESGVGKIFKSGSSLSEIVDFIRSNVREKGV
jgi:methylmalonyl-CoA mutase C-terminal domain/subunit